MHRARVGRRAAAAALAVLSVAVWAFPAAAVPVREDPRDRATYDPYFAEQWALGALGAPAAWARSVGRDVKVGVVDTGVDLAHEDLAGKVVAATGCLGLAPSQPCSGSAQDDAGHGTSVAGIIAADTANGKGIAAVAPGALLVVAKALDAHGSGTVGDVAAAIHWVVDHGARVVNLSLEADGTTLSTPPGQSLADAVEYAWHRGAVPVVAAGNAVPSVFGARGYAGLDAVIVGATGRSGALAWYSGPVAGAKWAVVAPGGDERGPAGTPSCAGALATGCVVSAGWFRGGTNAYAVDEGTSMAAAEVSGVLALLLAQGLTPAAAVERLLATADAAPCGAGCVGAVDAARAVGVPTGPRPIAAAALAAPRVAPRPHRAAPLWPAVVVALIAVGAAAWGVRAVAARSRPSRRS
ncbi:MAG TPA: S8 family serine peptidase [Acidimicrobiales bacterium]|nr:S8 family serine peptidase [Acidimicrobiales bacterium]